MGRKAMNKNLQDEETSWGFRLNRYEQFRDRSYPAWANPLQRDKWGKAGLILWDSEQQQVTKLSWKQTAELLNHLQTHSEWRDKGLTVGEPVTRLSVSEPERDPEPTLIHKIYLNQAQAAKLFELLESDATQIEELVEMEKQEESRILAEVYRYLISKGKERKDTS